MQGLKTRLCSLIVCGILTSLARADETPTHYARPHTPRTPDSAVTPNERNPKRHEKFLKIAAAGNIGLLFIGDSILDILPSNGPKTWAKFAPYHPADFGVGGELTEDVLWRLENGELDGINPKVVVLLIGTNNLGWGDKPEWVAAGITKIVGLIRQKLPESKILLLGIFPRQDQGPAKIALYAQEVPATNQIIAKLDDGRHIRYLDIGSKFLDAEGKIPHDVMRDKLHPTAKGDEIWYDAMWPTLEEMLK
jgi:lysophospholipase L1-like esterase